MVMRISFSKSTFRQIRSSFGRFLSIFAIIGLGVGFFSGLRQTKEDMIITTQNFLESLNFYDMRCISTLGFSEKDVQFFSELDCVECAEGDKSFDVLIDSDSGSETVYHLMAIPENINQINLKAGRLPEAENECLADSLFYSEEDIGTSLHISSSNEEDTLGLLKYKEFKIVGLAASPLYINFERGNTTLGTGSVSCFLYVPEKALDMDYYTQIYLTIKNADGEIYSSKYNNQLDAVSDKLEKYLEERASLRYEELDQEAEEKLEEARMEIRDAQKELDDGWAEYYDGLEQYNSEKKDADVQLNEALQQLDNAYETLEQGWGELENSYNQLISAKEKLESGQSELDSQKTQYQNKVQELETQRQALQDMQSSIDQKRAELDSSQAQLNDKRNILDQSQANLDVTLSELDTQQASVTDSLNVISPQISLLGENITSEEDALSFRNADAELDILEQQLAVTKEDDPNYSSLCGQKIEILSRIESVLGSEYYPSYQSLDSNRLLLYQSSAVLSSSYAQISQTQAEIDAGYAEINALQTNLDSAYEELNAYQVEIDSGLEEIYNYDQELISVQSQLDAAQEEINSNWNNYSSGLSAYTSGREQLYSGQDEYDTSLDEYNHSKEEAETKLSEAREELEEAHQKLLDGENELQEARQELEDAEQEKEDSLSPPDTYLLTRSTNVGYACFESDSDIVAGVSRIFPIFFFLVSALVCITTMTRMVEDDRTQIGVFKALGYSSQKIAWRYLFYSGSASLLGCIAGFFSLGACIPQMLWQAYNIMYGFCDRIEIHYDFVLGLVCTLVFMIVALGATWYVCINELKAVPADLIRPKVLKSGKKVFLEHIRFIWKHMNFFQKVSYRNIFRYRQRLIMMVLGIGGCMALLITGFGILDSISGIMDYQYEEISLYDAAITFRHSLDEKDIESFYQNYSDNISSVCFLRQSTVDVSVSGTTKSSNLQIFDKNPETFVDFHTTSETLSWPETGTALVSKQLAKSLNLSIGDSFEITDADYHMLRLTVSGIFENHVYNYVVIDNSTYEEQLQASPEINTALLLSRADSDIHLTSARLLQDENILTVSVSDDIRSRIGDMMQSLDYILLVILVCAGALAFIVLYNLTNINITERQREIATLKVLGFRPRETEAYVLRENFALTVMGIIFGLPMGKFLHRFVMNQIQIDLVSFSVRINLISYFYASAITIFFTCMVNLLMRRHLDKIDMAESLKSIE